jgi:hypothetical protein
MQSSLGSPFLSFGSRLVARTPFPVRILAVIWLALSLAFNLGLPASTANFPPAVRFLILLPMALLSLGLGVFTFWRGCKTIHSTMISVSNRQNVSFKSSRNSTTVIGGLGALQIYMILYMVAAFWLASARKSYGLSVVLSIILAAAIAYALFARKPHPKDVSVFLIGGLLITVLFGIIMATVAVPPA